ncbi:MAG: MaoC/PaaZ C-terminal domain-containing protein [Pseudomonadota bacterium]
MNMTVRNITEVEFGSDLPAFTPDNSLANVRVLCGAAGWDSPRFTDHDAARELGLAGAIVPGIMSQGFLAAMIHSWAPVARIERIDTVFRAPVLVDEPLSITATVTDIDEDVLRVELDLTVSNAKGETRVFGTAKLLFDA